MSSGSCSRPASRNRTGIGTGASGLMGLLLWIGLAASRPPADGYPRQPLDVEHYRFAITLSDSSDRIEGVATVRMRLLAAGLTSVALDLIEATPARQDRGMRVSSVSSGGKPLGWSHANDRLSISLEAPSRAGQLIEFEIRYGGIPAGGLQIQPTRYGDRSFFSDDWPDRARHWLPTIDHIADKATMEMAVTAPAHYQVISNGLRGEETDLPGGMRRTVWRESVPISPWLYVLGVARFAVQRTGDYHGVPLETWVFAQDRDAGFHDFAVPTPEVMDFFSTWIGPFAYEKLANVQSASVSGGMEAASAILYSASSVSGTRPVRWRNVVIHEIAHQWFGDAVTESDWDDVWLSEGFATYFTLLFIEHAYGRDEFVAGLQSSRKTVVDFATKDPAYRVVHQHLTDMAQVTSAMTYQKGSWVLHMLRQRLGDDRFWAAIRDYYARYRNGTASTSEFREAMERAAGEDLKPFFDQWLYRGGIPRLQGGWHWDRRTGQLRIELRQVQDGEPFHFPLELGIQLPGAPLRVEQLVFTGPQAELMLPLPQAPTNVVMDPNTRLLYIGQLTER